MLLVALMFHVVSTMSRRLSERRTLPSLPVDGSMSVFKCMPDISMPTVIQSIDTYVCNAVHLIWYLMFMVYLQPSNIQHY